MLTMILIYPSTQYFIIPIATTKQTLTFNIHETDKHTLISPLSFGVNFSILIITAETCVNNINVYSSFFATKLNS